MKTFFQALRILIFFSLLTGIAYPFAMTAISQAIFSKQASGSLIEKDGKVVGSSLLAQKFTKSEYFWPRPSGADYNANPSGASNLGPTSKDLQKQINDRREQLSKSLEVPPERIPQELLTTSASGLDPDLSPEGAKIQIMRVVNARKWPNSALARVNTLVDTLTQKRTFGILGETRVNVLKLNLALDELKPGDLETPP